MSGPAERRIGNVIGGKWRVDSLLGSGSMAAVYAVTHRNGARAALKILHPTLCADTGVCERFLGEGYLTNSVKHVGIVRVLDDGVTDDGCVFLVMDLLEGRTLEQVRQDCGGQIPLPQLLDIADKLMDVLHAVHQGGIIHRDLKLQNVFVCNDGMVKLLDFGVARVFDGSSQSKLSMYGLVLGTPSFMSPEQAVGSRDKVDHCSDIWSLGATLFTSLTGQTVHLGPHVQAKLLAAATMKARSITMVKPDLPAPVAAAIDMALRFDKTERWQNVEAFRLALRDARLQLGLGKPQSVPPPNWLDETPVHGRRGSAEGGPRDDPPPAAPRGELAEGGTLIVPGGGAALSEGEGSTIPQIRAAAPSSPEIGGSPPAGRGRSPIESRPEGSYPAVGSTLEHNALLPQTARPSSLGTWIAGAVVVGVLVGGIGFFAMRGVAPTSGAQNVANSGAPPLTSAPIDPPPQVGRPVLPSPPNPSSVTPDTIDTGGVVRDASVATSSPLKASVSAAPATHPKRLDAPRSKNSEPRNNGGPPIPTTLPPDPFGTPD